MEIAKNQFEILLCSIRSYLQVDERADSPLATALQPLLAEHGWQILQDAPALERLLAGCLTDSAEPARAQAARLCLLAMTPGFEEFMDGNEHTGQADLERVVQNALVFTGLSRETVLRLTGDVAWAAGIAVLLDNPQSLTDFAAARPQGLSELDAPSVDRAYVVPTALYRDILQQFEKTVTQLQLDSSVNVDLTPLEPLVAMGVPRAQYYVGFCLLHGIGAGENSEKGVNLLHAAADSGVAAAAAALGDHYFQKGGAANWSRAYTFYTGFGLPALTGKRQKALAGILNQRLYNRKVFAACAVFLALCAATVFGAPAKVLYDAHTLWGCICLLLQAAILGAALLRYRKKPYDFFYPVPVTMFGLWGLYMAIRLLF